MAPIDDAIAAIEARELGEDIVYQKYADKYGVNRSTLSRRHRRVTRSNQDHAASRQALNTTEESELVEYIKKLTEQGLPPTREMIRNFTEAVHPRRLSEAWVTRFLHRHQLDLTARWQKGLDRQRHQADSIPKYTSYFDLLHGKIVEHRIEQRHSYNMDEKGFMIGVEGRNKRIFSRAAWEKGGIRAAIQDGNRGWITVIPTICADGTVLPTGIIFEAKNGNIRDTWVNELRPDEDSIFVTSSPSGWTNEELGLAWLRDIFDRYTKEKARRSYRLLVTDGHSSHVSKPFIDYCDQNRILLAIYPPHSTHTLQPLDVVLFSPLARAYSAELSRLNFRAQGLLSVNKSDFIPLFKAAFTSAFTEKNILKGFRATGIWPMDREVVIEKFNQPPTTPDREANTEPGTEPDIYPNTWDRVDYLLTKLHKEVDAQKVRELETSVHRATTQSKLMRNENEGLRASLVTKNKRRRHGKVLPLAQTSETGGGGAFYSPRKVAKGRAERLGKEQKELQEKAAKAKMKDLKAASKLLKEKLLQEKRVAAAEAKLVKEKEKAEKAAEKARNIEARNTQKAIQQAQKGKRKASQASSTKNKRQKQSGGGAATAEGGGASIEPPSKVTSRGRSIKVPQKFR
jgi:hypothetical protein